MRTSVFLLLLAAASAVAKDPVDPVNKNSSGLAIKGYDTVAYFTEGKPVKGSDQFTQAWNGATWRFSSAANRDRFAADPAKFAPQDGAYCAWAVHKNYTADTDPEAWKVVGGKLYLNYNKEVQSMWQKDVEARIAVADKNWPKLHK